jgi:SNF2 family DNA or RNA helicase
VTYDFSVHGELSADGAKVVVFVGGNVEMAAGYLKLLTPHFGPTEPRGGLQAPLTWPLLVQMGQQLGKAWVPGPRLLGWMREQVIARTTLEPLTGWVNPDAPPPRAYQIAGAQLIASTNATLITDEPGTGKTLTTLLGIVEKRARGQLPIAGPILVICPNSVMNAWVDAAHRWTDLRAVAWRGSPQRRERLIGTADVYVAGYGVATNDADPHEKRRPLHRLAPVHVVIDECHLIKNPNSLRSKAVRKLAGKALSVTPLSGTPITHHTGDLWPTLFAMEPGAWPSRERFSVRYLDTVAGDYSDRVLGINAHTEPEFRMTLMGQHRRMAKADVLDQLPPKVYSVREAELPPAARKAYESMKGDMLAQMADGQEIPAMDALSQLLRLLQLACAEADVEITEEVIDVAVGGVEETKQHVHVTLREHSWKVDVLMEILDERPDKQTLVFAPSRQLVELGATRAEKAGLRVARIVGGQSAKERTAELDAFQAGQRDVMFATTQAGGVGITLTAASTVVFLQRPWSFVEASQAEDRAHRIGSEVHESIEIIDIVAKDTIDADVRKVLREKSGALAQLLEDPRIMEECLGGNR